MINHWRNNVEPTFIGVPFTGLMAYTILIYVYSSTLFFLITGINVIYAILHWQGYKPSSFYYRVMSKLRGSVVYSRPWWYREQWSKHETF